MKSVNEVMLIGNVGNEPEVRATSSGARVASLSLATNRTWSDRSGAKQEKTEWHRLKVWGSLVDVVEQWVHKGDRLYIRGRIEYSSTDGDKGEKKYWTDVVVQDLVMLGGKDRQAEDAGDLPPMAKASAKAADPDPDLPFAPLRLLEPLAPFGW